MTHKLKDGKGRDFNERYKEILDHYGLKATDQLVQCARERGAGTPPPEGRQAQELILAGAVLTSSPVEQYAKFVRRIVDRRNRLVREKLTGEYPLCGLCLRHQCPST